MSDNETDPAPPGVEETASERAARLAARQEARERAEAQRKQAAEEAARQQAARGAGLETLPERGDGAADQSTPSTSGGDGADHSTSAQEISPGDSVNRIGSSNGPAHTVDQQFDHMMQFMEHKFQKLTEATRDVKVTVEARVAQTEKSVDEISQTVNSLTSQVQQLVLGASRPAAPLATPSVPLPTTSAPLTMTSAPQDGAVAQAPSGQQSAPAAQITITAAPQTAPNTMASQPAAPQLAPLVLQTAAASSGYFSSGNGTPAPSAQGIGAGGPAVTPTSTPSGTNWTEAKDKKVNARLKEIRMYTGEEKEDLEGFIEEFQELQDDLQLTDEEVAMHIKNKIKSDAKICYKGMKEEDKKSPDKIFATFQKRFGEILSLQKFSMELAAQVQKEHQSVRKYYNTLERLRVRRENFVRDTLGEEKVRLYKEVWNAELVNIFRKGLKPELLDRIVAMPFEDLQSIFEHMLQVEVGLSNMKQDTAQRKAHVGLISEATIMQVHGETAASSANNSTQMKVNGQEKPKRKGECFKCKSTEHWANECPQRNQQAAKQADRNGPQCYLCGQSGHMRRQCPKKGSMPVKCYICGDPSHVKPNCPNILCRSCLKPGHWAHECLLNNTDQTIPKNL